MKITHIEYERLDLKLSEGYTIAYESIHKTTNLILKIHTDDGLVGYGCAAPDKEVTKETADEVVTAIEEIIIPYLTGRNPFTYALILDELAFQLKASALAMVDIALFDVMSKRANVPLYKFLGGFRKRIATSITIGILPLEETMEKAAFYHSEGFWIIKLKGGLNVEEDISKLFALRKKYPKMVLRFDGNQGYDLETTKHFIKSTKAVEIEILEQPTAMKNESIMGIISENYAIPLMADESLKSLKDAFRLTSNGYSDMINIKIIKVGGLLAASHINSVAKAANNEVMIGCLDECALGISAGLHFALSRPNVEFADLDGHLDIVDDPFKNLFELKNGYLYPNEKVGIGI